MSATALDTVAEFEIEEITFDAMEMFSVTLELPPITREPVWVHVMRPVPVAGVQLHPAPVKPVREIPVGRVSVIVMGEETSDGPLLATLRT